MLLRARPRGRAIVGALLTTVVLAAAAVPAPADDRTDELQEAIGEASQEEAAALAQLSEVRGRRAQLDAELAQLDAEVGAVQARITELQATESRLQKEANQIDAKARATDAELRQTRAEAIDAATAMYRGDSQAGAYAHLLDVSSLEDAAAGTVYLRHVSSNRLSAADRLDTLAQQLASQKAEADRQRDAARQARAEADQEADRLAVMRAQQAQRRDQVASEEHQEQQIVASIQSRKADYERELAVLQSSSSDIGSMLYARQQGQPRGNLVFQNPPANAPITSSFGSRLHPILGIWRMHAGVDMGTPWGTTVRAVADGTVVRAGNVNGYGLCVIVDHGNQYATLYAHGSGIYASVGQHVEAGDALLASGSSGLSTGPHLHFEVRLLGTPIDPAPFF